MLFAQKIILHFAFSVFSYDMQLPADVASNWLACFPILAQKYVYDVFFVRGFVTEVLQILVPFLQQSGSDGLDVNAVISNSERYDMNVHIVPSLKCSFLRLKSHLLQCWLSTFLCLIRCNVTIQISLTLGRTFSDFKF